LLAKRHFEDRVIIKVIQHIRASIPNCIPGSLNMMDKIIPILPCPDIKGQVAFYQQLGFELLNLYTSPNPYAVI
jgi:hypothetical protein